jgi:outer membrane protein OmpA-like peptidoglycan-associated protein
MRKSFPIYVSALLAIAMSIDVMANPQGGDLRRRTIAITYLKDPVTVILSGTTLLPRGRGEGTVERWRKRNESEIDMKIENMVAPYTFGGDYTTYVLWAITPAGQVDNLGEFRLKDGKAQLKAATPNQTFAMIVTAEPHFMVKLPSPKVVLENLAPVSKNVQIQSSEISFTGDSGAYYKDTTLPTVVERDFVKTPMELLQARRALQIARLADGERFDPDDYSQASALLQSAEVAYRRDAPVHDVGRIARDSIALSVRVRDIAEEKAAAAARRSELARRDAEVRRANETASDLSSRLTDTEAQLKASEIARVNAQDQLDRALHEAADARAENRSLRNENERLRVEAERMGQDLADARSRINQLQQQYSSTNAQLAENTSRVQELQRKEEERQRMEARRRDFASLQSVIAGIVTVKPTGNGFVATLPDSFFMPNRTTLHVRARAKMDALSQALASQRDLTFTIQGNWDASRLADANALGRAQAVGDYIAAYGVPRTNFKVESLGSSMLVSRGRTVSARAANRRVELVFTAPQ